jgi:hypothetical protein
MVQKRERENDTIRRESAKGNEADNWETKLEVH